MSAGPETVAGSQVGGSTNITGGTDHINGAVATLADDVTSINAATQDAKTLPGDYKVGSAGFWGKVAGKTDGGY
jgi:hypothetical protein